MMPFNPDSWLDLVAYLILGVPAILAAAAAFIGQKKARAVQIEHKAVADATLHEVANSHDTNLRDDIDGLKRAISEGFIDTRKDIGGLREEIRTERLERIEGDRPRWGSR